MLLSESLALAMIIALCLFTLIGFPVAFTLAGVAIIFATIGTVLDVFDASFLGFIPNRLYGIMTNYVLIAIPLFVFMGVMLERSKVAEDLLTSMARLFGRFPAGLGISVVIVGALLAASTGIVGATVVTMGLLSLPTMLRQGYDPALACGSITAAGTLGQIIPPSIVLVVLGDQISNAYQQAQRELGNFAPEPVAVSDLFAGALVPGLVLVGLYIVYLLLLAWLKPEVAPPLAYKEALQLGQLIRALLAPLLLMIAVLGAILAGIATPTEAAAVGAVGAILLAGLRQPGRHHFAMYAAVLAVLFLLALKWHFDIRLSDKEPIIICLAVICCVAIAWGLFASLWRLQQTRLLSEVVFRSARFSSMIFVIIIGASLFAIVLRGFGGDELIVDVLSQIPGGVIGAMLAVMALMFVMGFFLDVIEIIFVVVPLVAPVLLQMEIHPIWLGVMFAVNLQTSFLTPPLGYALFYLRSVAPPQVTTLQLYKGVIPFVILQLVLLALLATFPSMATWLPTVIFG